MRLAEFVGNEATKARVTSMLASGRLPHAILIEGASGSGRRTLARIIADVAVCTGESAPCGRCAACRSGDSNPDIMTVVAEKTNITVDIIRSVRNQAYIKPNQSARKVFIIPNAQQMNPQAQNALLKVLEEPPAEVMFILTCEYARQLLETVVSRVSVLSLSGLKRDEAVRYICDNYEQYTADEVDAAFESTIGAALERLEGTSGYMGVAEQAAELVMRSELELHKFMKKYEKDRAAQRGICTAMESLFHAALVKRTSRNGDVAGISGELSNRFTAQRLIKLKEVCRRAANDSESNMGGALFITDFCARVFRAVE